MLHNGALINKSSPTSPSASTMNLVQILFMNNLFIITAEKMYSYTHIKSSINGGVYLYNGTTGKSSLLGAITYTNYFTNYYSSLPIVNCVEQVTAKIEDCVLKYITVISGENGVCIL